MKALRMVLMNVKVKYTLVVEEELVPMLFQFLEQMDLYSLLLLLKVGLVIKTHHKLE